MIEVSLLSSFLLLFKEVHHFFEILVILFWCLWSSTSSWSLHATWSFSCFRSTDRLFGICFWCLLDQFRSKVDFSKWLLNLSFSSWTLGENSDFTLVGACTSLKSCKGGSSFLLLVDWRHIYGCGGSSFEGISIEFSSWCEADYWISFFGDIG